MTILEGTAFEEKIQVLDDRFYTCIKCDTYHVSVTTILQCFPKGAGFAKWLADTGWDEAKRKKDTAGQSGTDVHDACELLLDKATLSFDSYKENEWRMLIAFRNFCEDYKPETVEKEHKTISCSYGYAGKMDWAGFVTPPCKKKEQPKKIFVRVDWKTSNNLWPEYDLQLSGYEMAERENGKQAAEELLIVHLGTKTKRGYSIHKVKDPEIKFREGFLPTLALWKYLHKDAKPFAKDLPRTLSLSI